MWVFVPAPVMIVVTRLKERRLQAWGLPLHALCAQYKGKDLERLVPLILQCSAMENKKLNILNTLLQMGYPNLQVENILKRMNAF